MPHKLPCHKTVVGHYSSIFLKWLEIVITNHDFNFKFKAAVGDYGFDHSIGDYDFDYFFNCSHQLRF